MENSLNKLDQQGKKYVAELEAALAQYTELQQQAADMDASIPQYLLSNRRFSVLIPDAGTPELLR